MYDGWDRRNDRDICIICRERMGSIRTVDGLVCVGCMPRDLMVQASSLKAYQIISYMRVHGDSCRSGGPSVRQSDPDDRSMAFTADGPTTLAEELNEQIRTADSIDIVVSFIKISGLCLVIDSLSEFARRGRLRVVTTAYMGATEYDALAELFLLPNTEVRMELTAERSRLHAKSFLFHRTGGRSTAFVGSANISKTALTDGEEWVVKLREQDVPLVISDLDKGYESLWSSQDLRPVTARDRARIESAFERRGK